MDYVFGSAGAITGQGAENIPICEQRGKSVLNPHLLLLLSVLLLGVKLLFGDVPTVISFFRVALDVNKNRKLRVWLRYLLKGKVDNGDGEMQVIHFGKYNYPLLMGKISAYSSAPYQIFDRTINDPHRWLEDMDDSRTKLWLDEQKVVTNTILGDTQATPSNMESNVGGLLDAFASKIKQSGMFDDVDTVFQRGKSFFYFRSTKSVAGEPENIQLFITKSISADCFSGRLSRIDRVLLRQPDDESKTTISGTWIDNDGEMLAYALANDLDGDWLTIRVRDIVSGEDYEDTLTLNCHRASTAVTWHNKRTGFFYSCFDSGGSGMGGVPVTARHRVCFHRLNTAQSEDLVIYEDTEPSRDTKRSIFVPRMSHDSHYLLLEVYEEDFQFLQYVEGPHTSEGTDPVNRLFFVDTYRFNGHDLKTLGKVVKLIDGRGGNFRWDYITNIEEDFWFRTNYCAEHFRIVRVSVPSTDTITKARGARLQLLSDAAWHTALEWIPETADGAFLESASIAAQTVMVLKYIRGLSNDVVLYDLTQSLNDTSRRPCAELPNSPYGVIRGPYSNFYSNSIFYTTSSFSDPGSIWRATITRSSITHSVEVGFEPICFRKVPNVDLYSYEVSQLHIPCRRHCTVVAPDKGTRQGAETVYPSLQPFNGQQGGASASASAGAGGGAGGSQSPDRAVGGVREGNQKSNSRRRTYVDNSRDEVSLLLFHSRDYLNEDQFSSTPGASNAASRTSIRPSSHKAGAGMGMGLGSRRSGSRGVSGATVRESTLFKSAFGRSTKPCLLYVHGSFGVSVMPTFSLPLLLYCKHFEAMLCVVNVRGGGRVRAWVGRQGCRRKQTARRRGPYQRS
jgi:protease II